MSKVFSIDSKKQIEKEEAVDKDGLENFRAFTSSIESELLKIMKEGYRPDIFIISVGLQHESGTRSRDFFINADPVHTQESIIGLIEITKTQMNNFFDVINAGEDEDD